MNAAPEKGPDLSVEVPDEESPTKDAQKASEAEVPKAKDIDPSDGTDQHDKPIDNPSG